MQAEETAVCLTGMLRLLLHCSEYTGFRQPVSRPSLLCFINNRKGLTFVKQETVPRFIDEHG